MNRNVGLFVKLLGVLCVLAIVLTTLFVPMGFGVSAAGYSATFDFQSHALEGYLPKSVKILREDGIGFDDNAALRYDYKGDYVWKVDKGQNVYYANRSGFTDHVGVIDTLENKKVYKISYYIKAVNVTSDFELCVLTGNAGNVFEPNTLRIYDGTKEYFSKDTDLSDWTKIETIIVTDFKEGARVGDDLMLALSVVGKSMDTVVDILVDKVTVTEIKEEIIVLNTNGATDKPVYLFGNEGEEIEYPELENDGLSFLGWYKDADFNDKFEAVTFPEGITPLYAKWGGEIFDFDSYGNSSSLTVSMNIEKGSAIGYNSNEALHFDFDGDSVWKTEGDKVTYYYQRDNGLDHRAVITELKNNTAYKISYYVKAREATCGFNIRLATGHGSNIFESNTLRQYTTTLTEFGADDVSDEWIKVEHIIVTDFAISSAKTGDDLFILFDVDEKKPETKVDLLLDRVVVSEITDKMVVFNTNVPSEDPIYIFGNEGDEIEFPEVENSGLNFAGWYTDKEFVNEFTDTTFSAPLTMLYAKWTGDIIEFDDYGYNMSLKPSTSVKKENGLGENDDFALGFNFVGDKVWEGSTLFWQRSNDLDHRAAIVTVKDKTTYTITYTIKVEEANSPFSVRFATGHGSNIFEGGARIYNETARNFSETDVGGGYIKRTVVLTTEFGETTGSSPDELFILFSVLKKEKGTVVNAFVDKVTVVETPDANGVFFDSNAEGVDNDFQLGEIGGDIVFPTFTNGEAEFLGWYADKYCEIPFAETKIKEGFMTAYAKWSTLPITFENYAYQDTNTGRFGTNMSIVSAAGVGVDDDYKLNFNFYGDVIRGYSNTGKPVYWRERIDSSFDNIARLGVLQNKTAYTVSFMYKANAEANADAKVTFMTGDASNIWLTQSVTAYRYANIILSKDNIGWTKAEVTFITDFKQNNGEMLFLTLSGADATVREGIRMDFDFDNVVVEKVEKPYIFFDAQEDGFTCFAKGKAGERIVLPETNPKRVGFDFAGWFLDKEATIPLTQTEFEDGKAIIVYAGWTKSNYALYDFENYGLTKSSGYLIISDGMSVGKVGAARSGENSIKLDRTGLKKVSCAIIADNANRVELEPGKRYAVSFWYYVEKRSASDAKISFRTAGRSNAFENAVGISDVVSVSVVAETGVWKQRTVVVDTSLIKDKYLYIVVEQGLDGVFYVDDIEINTLPEGYVAYTVDNGECDAVPQYVAGPIGSSFANKLPKNPKKTNHVFVGYIAVDESGNREDLIPEKMVFSDKKLQIIATFVRLNTLQNFDDGEYLTFLGAYNDYAAFDFDYEIYNANKQGNSKDNVASGNYALHRKGNSMYVESAQILTQNQRLVPGQRYTITMKVKLGKHLHTDGAVKVFSNFSAYYPWAKTGDAYPIAVIADLKENEWKEVSYTFYAVEEYLSIQTPGYVELFIDDIVIKRVTGDVELSKPPAFTEYVVAKRDETGAIIEGDTAIDISSIIDPTLKVPSGSGLIIGGKNTNVFIVIGAVVLVAVAVLLMALKKRKNKKA